MTATFRGYRGFGICRDLARINHLARARRERPIGLMAPPETTAMSEGASATTTLPEAPESVDAAMASPPRALDAAAEEIVARPDGPSPPEGAALDVAPAAANVVPFRSGAAPEPKPPTLSPVERKAFRELAQELTARLRGVREDFADVTHSGGLAADGEADAAEPAPAPGGHGGAGHGGGAHGGAERGTTESGAAPPATGEQTGASGEATQAAPRQPIPAFEPRCSIEFRLAC